MDNVVIVPGSGVQFLDLQLDAAKLAKQRLNFVELGQPDDDDAVLLCVEEDADGELIDRASGVAVPSNVMQEYSLQAQKILQVFEGQWLPLPLFRIQRLVANAAPEFAAGPTDWVRVRVDKLPAPETAANGTELVTHGLTLVFDTVVEALDDAVNDAADSDSDTTGNVDGEGGSGIDTAASMAESGAQRGSQSDQPTNTEERVVNSTDPDACFPALTQADLQAGSELSLAHREADCGDFLLLEWVDDWLYELDEAYELRRRKGRARRPEDLEDAPKLQYVARYLTFLDALDSLEIVPRVRLIDPARQPVVDVDLVLDVGNSRTCGVLVETHPDSSTDLNDSYALELRDLSHPWQRYRDPFPSRVEFSLASFGDASGHSKKSGRHGESFVWPSLVRVGDEAACLARHALGVEGRTGSSSPKRYLWDSQPREEKWCFNTGVDAPRVGEPPVTQGVVTALINDLGSPLPVAGKRRERTLPVIRPQFCRSALTHFMLGEILAQTLSGINSITQRMRRRNAHYPRRLRRLILTMPTAMSIAERKRFEELAHWAVGVTWQALGWSKHFPTGRRKRQAGAVDNAERFRQPPEVICRYDEASATQLVYLYNEVARKYRGVTHAFFGALGYTDEDGVAAMRVASLDIGGGTSDLIITRYRDVGSGGATVIDPLQEFREGFNVAGDDVLRAIIERVVLRTLMEAMERAGVAMPRELCSRLFGSDFGDQSAGERFLRAQVASQILAPIALRFLHHFEQQDEVSPGAAIELAFGDFFVPLTHPRADVIAYVDDAVRAQGGRDFDLSTLRFRCESAHFQQAVNETLAEVLGDLCELVYHYRCDILLLSGRTSRLPAVRQAVLAALPLPPHRVVNLAEYRVGTWYPFRGADGTVGDPKTTAVVGAMLCALAEGHLEGFSFHAHRLDHRSTARFFGPLDGAGRIRKGTELFEQAIDLDSGDELELETVVDFHAPIQIGFRQLPLERWPVTPFYWLDFADAEARRRSVGRTPYKVSLVFLRDAARDEDDITEVSSVGDLQDEGVFSIDDVETSDGDAVSRSLTLRLQTLRDGAGHWLDTGSFTVI